MKSVVLILLMSSVGLTVFAGMQEQDKKALIFYQLGYKLAFFNSMLPILDKTDFYNVLLHIEFADSQAKFFELLHTSDSKSDLKEAWPIKTHDS